ncbi:hypothetical protein [Alkalicoccobacillus porphyridii]|uniref:Uncharacterized protein n=1 Tax=Alkalicoccobacillus porphyridii TaxID=2597270 RepID=A0A554A087_9BACI|nr:hypothetical protein [Alkalicoccobacillus porphyridii]TSB47109.1 hypothetical protein FN960_08830 [Alkalicoccobacillus porphyridii]
MKNQQDLIEVVVGKILDKHNVSMATDLSSRDKLKVKSTVLDIQTEVDKFLSSIDMDTVGGATDSLFEDRFKQSLTSRPSVQEEAIEDIEDDSTSYYEEPQVARIVRRPVNKFNNRNRRRF